MSKYRAPAPELDQAFDMIPTDLPRGVAIRLLMQRDRAPGRALVWFEVAHVNWEGRYLPALRFGEAVSSTSDAQMRGAIFRCATRLRVWFDDNEGADLVRLVAWQAGAHDLAGRPPTMR